MLDLLESLSEPVALLDDHGALVYANRRMSVLLGDRPPHSDSLGALLGPEQVRLLRAAVGAQEPRWTCRVHPPGSSPLEVVVDRRKADNPSPPYVLRVRQRDLEGEADLLLRRIVAHTPGAGQLFFEQLVAQLAAKLGVRWAYLGSREGDNVIRVLALADGSRLLGTHTYDFRDSPCEEVLQHGVAQYPARTARLYPKMSCVPGVIEAFVGVALTDALGEPSGVLAVMHDAPIHNLAHPLSFLKTFAARASAELIRYNAEQLADRQRAFSEGLLDQVGAFVVVLDDRGRITRVNRALEHDLGWTTLELVGHPFHQTLAVEDVRAHIQRVLQGEELPFRSGRWRAVSGQRHVQWNARRVDAPDRGGNAVVVTAIDTTALQQTTEELDLLRERLMESRRLEGIGRLAGGVAHDFNNLLMAITGHADLIATEVESESEAAHSLREIRLASDQAASLTKQLLEFGRRQPLDRERVDLGQLVAQVGETLRPRLSPDIHLVLPEVEPGIFVLADRRRLWQVAMALAANAHEAMPGGGVLRLYARKEDGGPHGPVAVLEVTDSGTGIAPEILPHLFEPFFTTKELGRGTGLGLASSYGIVRQHGGSIDVDSAPGKGSTFRIWLPLAPDFAHEQPRTSRIEGTRGSGVQILLAEDDDAVRPLVCRLLQNAGHAVVSAADGEQAWAVFEHDPDRFDLLLLDVIMPRLGGPGLAARARARRPGVPIILTSGYVSDPGALPADIRVLNKPYAMDELVRAVEEAVSQRP
jgi:PAS domain S-box-containing protein